MTKKAALFTSNLDSNEPTHAVTESADGTVELLEVRQLSHGSPLAPHESLMKLTDDGQGLFDVEVLHEAPSRSRPTTNNYRVGWDRIFGGSSASALN